MKTSYFGSIKIKGLSDLISISMKPPKYFLNIVKIYKPLCPSYQLVMEYKKSIITEYEYERQYYSTILDCLDPKKVYRELGDDSILLCYEKSGEFCHRRLVAKWFKENLNIDVPEL
jgi:hypothetical protein